MVTVEQLLQQINANVQEVREMLNDNLYITCFDDGEISIVYMDLPGSTYDKQVDMAYPKIIEFIKSNGAFVEDLIRNKHPELETLDNIDTDTLCDIVYEITESNKFEKFMIEYFEEDPQIADQIAEYAQEEFDYDIYIHEYMHTITGYDDNGEPYERLNPRYEYMYMDECKKVNRTLMEAPIANNEMELFQHNLEKLGYTLSGVGANELLIEPQNSKNVFNIVVDTNKKEYNINVAGCNVSMDNWDEFAKLAQNAKTACMLVNEFMDNFRK